MLKLDNQMDPNKTAAERSDNSMEQQSQTFSRIGFLLGPVLALLIFVFFRPDGLPATGTNVAAVAVWMAVWWATEATHVAVTAFIPMLLFPLIGAGEMSVVAASYAHPIIYLFLGGFVMAIAIQKSGLHHRFALEVFRFAGLDGKAIIAGFMIAAALISMWISNTSTTLMMLPMAMSVSYILRETLSEVSSRELANFEKALFLGLAYGATMGGVSTLVGTPPNAFMSGFMESNYDTEIDFARWMIVGIPITLFMLPVTWFALTRILYPISLKATPTTKAHLDAKRSELGAMTKAETRVGVLFLLLILGWVLRKPIIAYTGTTGLTDAAIAMFAAVLAFLIPDGSGKQSLVSWDDTQQLPWGVLVLFGGGLALAGAMTSSGLTAWMGQQLAPLGAINTIVLILGACLLVIFLTEMTSNLATTATFLPIMAALAVETGQDPLIFVIPVTLAASFAFMLPVATPPNAIIFSSGKVSIPQMMRAGLLLNIISVIVLTVVSVVLVPRVFG